jgi:hypothetical protein
MLQDEHQHSLDVPLLKEPEGYDSIEDLTEQQKYRIEKFRLGDHSHSIKAAVVKMGEDIALMRSGCRCETCGSEQQLQFHHKIGRLVRKPPHNWGFAKYFTERYLGENILVLCWECHSKIHQFNNFVSHNRQQFNFISKSRLRRFYDRYGLMSTDKKQ